MATFAVFMHTMLSAALDTSFLASIVQNEEGTIFSFSCLFSTLRLFFNLPTLVSYLVEESCVVLMLSIEFYRDIWWFGIVAVQHLSNKLGELLRDENIILSELGGFC